MVVVTASVVVLVGEDRREGTFPIDESLNDICNVLLEAERREARRIRIVHAGQVRTNLNIALSDLFPSLAIERGGTVTLHAVVGLPGSANEPSISSQQHSRDIGASTASFGGVGRGSAADAYAEFVDIGGVKLQSRGLLLSITGTLLIIMWLCIWRWNALASKPSLFMLGVFSLLWIATAGRAAGVGNRAPAPVRASQHSLDRAR